MATTHTVEFSYNKTNGSYTGNYYVRVTLQSAYNSQYNRFAVALTKVEFKSPYNFGTNPVYGKVLLNDTVCADFDGGASNNVSASANTYDECSYGGDYGAVVVANDLNAKVIVKLASADSMSSAGFVIRYTDGNFGIADTSTAKTVNISAQMYTLTTGVSPDGYGSVSVGAVMLPYSTKTLTATPASSTKYTYSFDKWTKTSGTLSSTTANPTSFTIGTSDAQVVANFTRTAKSYTVTATKGNYIASVSGAGSKTYGSTVTLKATLSTKTGYTTSFDGWYNGDTKVSASKTYSFTMQDSDISLEARATRVVNMHDCTVSAGDNVSVVALNGETNPGIVGASIGYGASVSIGAGSTITQGYTISFLGWYDSYNNKVYSAPTKTFTMPNEDVHLTAKAEKVWNSYTLSISKPASGATVVVKRTSSPNQGAAIKNLSNGDAIYYGDVLKFSYSASTGYTIDEHTVNGTTRSTGYSFSVGSDVNVVVTVTATLTGYVWINNGNTWEAYIPYINNGSGWDRYEAYINNGSGWDAY